MGGVLKNNGLVKVRPAEEKIRQPSSFSFREFIEGGEFKDTSFENANLADYYNTGSLMRYNVPKSQTEKTPVPDKQKLTRMYGQNQENTANSDIPARPALRPGCRGARPDSEKGAGTGVNLNDSYNEKELIIAENEEVKSREEILAEYEQIKLAMLNEGEQKRNEAIAWAENLIETTQNDIKKLYEDTGKDAAEIKRKADESGYSEGYERGFGEGSEKGYNEGYNKGLRKCKDTLKELMTMLEELPALKDSVFKEYEHQLFDAIFTIANKITVDSIKQKDKAVIQKMLREAAKSFRNSEYIKISLSKLDVEEMGNAEMDSLREIFKESQHIEFEIVKDAPKGTLILDNGSEITDAGINTQLMMIEKLGKGKFRDKKMDDDNG